MLAGVSRHRLREWDRNGLLHPSYGSREPHVPYGRIYSFRDLVSARVLGRLQTQHRVSTKHLIETAKSLSALSDTPWASTVLYVLGRKVVVVEPGTRRKLEVVSGQRVLDIPLKLVISGVRDDVARLNVRDESKVGVIERDKFIAQNQPVLKGTRIPVAAIRSFADAGYSVERILREYPELTTADISSALAYTAAA